MGIRAVRGKEAIIVWRRGGWTSMAHLVDKQLDGVTQTPCGNEVSLGYGVDAIVMTQVTTDLFLAAGCGMCRMSMMRELRNELLRAQPDARAQLKALLKGLEWAEARR